MIEENEDVTEIYFIMSGKWGVGYKVDALTNDNTDRSKPKL